MGYTPLEYTKQGLHANEINEQFQSIDPILEDFASKNSLHYIKGGGYDKDFDRLLSSHPRDEWYSDNIFRDIRISPKEPYGKALEVGITAWYDDINQRIRKYRGEIVAVGELDKIGLTIALQEAYNLAFNWKLDDITNTQELSKSTIDIIRDRRSGKSQ